MRLAFLSLVFALIVNLTAADNSVTGTVVQVLQPRAGVEVQLKSGRQLYQFGPVNESAAATMLTLSPGTRITVIYSGRLQSSSDGSITFGEAIAVKVSSSPGAATVILFTIWAMWSVFIAAGAYQSYIRPYRSKFFFSYSHKDAATAERIMRRLKRYHFKAWVDFGKTIPPAELERELSDAVNPAEILIVLASSNSASSPWVEFEISRAKQKAKKGFRDIAILTLDDTGQRLQQSLTEFSARQVQDEYGLFMPAIRELGAGQSSVPADAPLRDKIAEKGLMKLLQLADRYGEQNRKFARLYGRETVLFDLRRPFEEVMDEVTDYLRQATKLNAGRVLTAWRAFMIGTWVLFTIGIITFWFVTQ